MSQEPDSSGQDKPRRRKRYSGTHPKHFTEKYKEHAIAAHPELLEHLRAKGKTPAGTHIPILVHEVMEVLRPAAGEVVADCTLGYGGHASEFMQRIGPTGRLVGFDVDGAELERTRQRLEELGVPMSLYRSNFAGIANVMTKEGLEGFDVIFADLGLSSMQIDNPARGMSYKHDGPLDMRMDDRRQRTAADLLNTLSEKELAEALEALADEPDCRAIARQVVQRRVTEKFVETGQLVALIFDVKGITMQDWKRRQNPGLLHPAALTFQALRILVNDEQGALRELLRVAPYCLREGGRIGILSFHSGEDRLVKHAFADGVRDRVYSAAAKDVITPSRGEMASNPRSSSAKLRWAIK
ncbi:MAG: 16S rRNA (cytosine(1402)-N(4))-methyltransferase RsmH [Sedimentisphaerales bacterium]|nr:16S rRNA (cytosine(1402)-N(4))-methyltransferase RsmH [Sedimentisphaerales bacterium]